MLTKNETIKKIDERFIRKNCVQVMEPFVNNITILGKEGLLFHHSDIGYINTYLNDYRKRKFPYSNIPMHNSFSVLHGKITYVNQLFDFDKSYFIFKDGKVTEIIIFQKDNVTMQLEKSISPRTNKICADGINFELLMKDYMTMYGPTYFLLSSGYLLTGFDNFITEMNDVEIIKKAIRNYEDIVWKVTYYYDCIFLDGVRINKNNEATFYHANETNLKDYDLDKLKCEGNIKIPIIVPWLNPEISKEKIIRANQKVKKLKTV